MAEPAKVVAVLVSNQALSSILSSVLASTPALRVRPFESAAALSTYMRIAPVDLLVCDFDSEAPSADGLARALRSDPALERSELRIIALASAVSDGLKRASIAAGIDEIVIKPMSPGYLLERVLSRLRRRSVAAGPLQRSATLRKRLDPLRSGGNVVPLFGPRLQPLH